MRLNDNRSELVCYDSPDYPILVQRALLSSYPNYAAPAHWHDDIELIAVLSGTMQYHVNGVIFSLSAGEGLFVNARQLHFGFSTEKTECVFCCVLLHPVLLCITPAYERDFVLPLLNHKSLPFLKLHPDVPWQRAIYEAITQMDAVKKEKTAPLKIQTSFLTLWTALYENTPLKAKENGKNTDLTVIKNMIGFIQTHYTEKISLPEIAAAGAVGQSKCCKLFTQYLGQTPNRYLTQYRLDQSTVLLKNTDLTVTEIATAAGFGGSSYYAETFRAWIGKSPTQYRKEAAKQRQQG